MTSNTFAELGGSSEENVEQIKEAARGELIRSYSTATKHIDDSSSATLKRLIKFLTGAADVQHMITGEELDLNDDEKAILDDLFEFSRTQVGFIALLDELNSDNTTETSEETNE